MQNLAMYQPIWLKSDKQAQKDVNPFKNVETEVGDKTRLPPMPTLLYQKAVKLGHSLTDFNKMCQGGACWHTQFQNVYAVAHAHPKKIATAIFYIKNCCKLSCFSLIQSNLQKQQIVTNIKAR